MRVKLNLL